MRCCAKTNAGRAGGRYPYVHDELAGGALQRFGDDLREQREERHRDDEVATDEELPPGRGRLTRTVPVNTTHSYVEPSKQPKRAGCSVRACR